MPLMPRMLLTLQQLEIIIELYESQPKNEQQQMDYDLIKLSYAILSRSPSARVRNGGELPEEELADIVVYLDTLRRRSYNCQFYEVMDKIRNVLTRNPEPNRPQRKKEYKIVQILCIATSMIESFIITEMCYL